MNDDYELLQAYAARGSEESFARLVERYVNLVHSAAWRQTRNDSLAQEVSQTVFLILARKAGGLSRKVIIPGWLLQTTRFAAANAVRREQRRQKAEDDLMNSTPLETPARTPASWDQISAELDEAIGRLGAGYRDAIALRFFEKKSLREVGEALGTTEDNAQKKVTRGLEKLRSLLGKRGASVSTGLLAALIGEHAVNAAPLGLPALVITAVARSGGVAAGVAAGVSGTLHLMALQRLKSLLLPAGSGLAVAIFVSTFLWHPVVSGKGNPPRPGTLALAVAPVAKTPAEPVATPAQALVAASSSAPNENLFQFRVIDALTESAVTNARLTLMQTQPVGRSTNIVHTGKDGVARLPWPDRVVENWSYRLEVYRDGYVPKYVSWGATQGDKLDDFPSAYSTRIDRGTRIGGTVVNEQESPIPGVTLVFSVSGSAPGSTRERERLTMMGSYHTEVTDDGGRWSCDHVPPQFGRVDWRLSHPYYQDTSYGSTAPEQDNVVGRPRIPMADLEKGMAVMTMKQGLRLAGMVIDGNSRPVAGAKVSTDRNFEPGRSLFTDADGRFEFRNARPKATVITVQAQGFAPDDRTVTPGPELEEQRFVLQPGSIVRGRVVTEAGQPMTNVSVSVAPDDRNRQTFEWSARTDAQGRFEWTNAPTGREFQVNSARIDAVSRIRLAADGSENTVIVKLSESRKRVVVKVEAVDAVTQEPLRSFQIKTAEINIGGTTVDPGLGNRGIALPMFSTPRPAGSGSSGQGKVAISSYTSDFFVEVSADGYLPARATNRNRGQGELALRLELRAAQPIVGNVHKPDGSPAAGAMAVLRVGRIRPSMTTPRTIKIAQSGHPAFVKTDTNGGFSFPPELDMRSVIVADESGFAEAAIKSNAVPPIITLQPWASVRGQLNVTGVVPGSQNVSLQPGGGLGVVAFQETKTDEHGRFVFEGVPPGEFKVAWAVRMEEGKITASRLAYGVPVTLHPGETAEVVLGGSGSTLVGSVSAEGIAGPIDWRNDVHTLTLQVPGDPKFAAPARGDFADQAAYAEALAQHFIIAQDFWETEAGCAVKRKSRLYVLRFDVNGYFQIPDVLPGTYELEIAPTRPNPTAASGVGAVYPPTPLGKLVIPVVVPESSIGLRVDLGRLQLRPVAP